MIEGEYVGALNLSSDSPITFTSEMIEIGKEIANQLAISIQQWKLREEILNYTKELEHKVEERTKELAHSNRELRDFAQIVSHDLKAPLRAISQLSYWLSTDYADKIDEDGQKQLNLLIGRVQRLDNLIEGILQFSRIGKIQEKEVEINLNNLVENTIELLNPPENIQVKIDTELPVITADPTRIGQLFQNLIQNAIKFMDKPKGFINIGVEETENFYEFYVKDNGCGIDKQYFNRIFKIFQRLVSRDETEGTGIGLSLVKRIAQIYGGDVRLSSKLGEGSTFYVTFPKNKDNK
jgi:light-regulated signal transduction histidine kinase (bacteriophytochrome)